MSNRRFVFRFSKTKRKTTNFSVVLETINNPIQDQGEVMPETEELKQKEEQKEVGYEQKEEEGEGMVEQVGDEQKDEEQNPGIDLTEDDQSLSKGG